MKRERKRGEGAAPAVDTQPVSVVQPAGIGVRFVKAHRHDGVDRAQGEQISVCSAAAEWLVALGVVVRVEA